MQMANDAAAEKPRSAKYRDNLPGRETNICCRRARYDRISAGLLDRDALTAAAMRLRSGFRYPAIRAYERLAGSRTNPRVYLWVIIDLSQPTNCKYAQKIDYLADGVGFEPTRSVNPCRFSRPVPSTARPPIRLVDRILGNSANHPKGRIGSASIADPAADPHLLADQVCIGKESRRCDGAARNPFGSLPFSRLLSILTVARASSLTEPGRDPSPGRFLFSVGEAGTAAGGRGAR
jgi:hypothetical protein